MYIVVDKRQAQNPRAFLRPWARNLWWQTMLRANRLPKKMTYACLRLRLGFGSEKASNLTLAISAFASCLWEDNPTFAADYIPHREAWRTWHPRVWMLCSQPSLSRLHHLHLHLLRLHPPSLIPIRRCQVGHTGQRGRMLCSQHSLSRLYHLHLQLFRFIILSMPSATVGEGRHCCKTNFMLYMQCFAVLVPLLGQSRKKPLRTF